MKNQLSRSHLKYRRNTQNIDLFERRISAKQHVFKTMVKEGTDLKFFQKDNVLMSFLMKNDNLFDWLEEVVKKRENEKLWGTYIKNHVYNSSSFGWVYDNLNYRVQINISRNVNNVVVNVGSYG